MEAWIAQIRFDAEASSGIIQSLISWAFLFLLFYQLTFTLAVTPLIAMPVQALIVAFVAVFLGVAFTAEDVRERNAVVQQYRKLLADIYLLGLTPDKVAERYAAVRARELQKRKWFRRTTR